MSKAKICAIHGARSWYQNADRRAVQYPENSPEVQLFQFLFLPQPFGVVPICLNFTRSPTSKRNGFLLSPVMIFCLRMANAHPANGRAKRCDEALIACDNNCARRHIANRLRFARYVQFFWQTGHISISNGKSIHGNGKRLACVQVYDLLW